MGIHLCGGRLKGAEAEGQADKKATAGRAVWVRAIWARIAWARAIWVKATWARITWGNITWDSTAWGNTMPGNSSMAILLPAITTLFRITCLRVVFLQGLAFPLHLFALLRCDSRTKKERQKFRRPDDWGQDDWGQDDDSHRPDPNCPDPSFLPCVCSASCVNLPAHAQPHHRLPENSRQAPYRMARRWLLNCAIGLLSFMMPPAALVRVA